MRTSFVVLIFAASLSTLACGPRDKDKLEDNQLATTSGGKTSAADTPCGAQAAQDEVKRQLFARAAEIRGSNADNYNRIAGFAVLQVDDAAPAATPQTGAMVDCRARATLRLPAGLKVAGGRTALGGPITYSVAPGAVTLGESDAIAIPLATLTQNRASGSVPASSTESVAGRDEPDSPPPPPRAPAPQPAPPPTVDRDLARPSFDCRRARTAGEQAVCDNPSLAALDRQMAAQYRAAVANGGPDDRRLLAQTRDRFLGFRDRCGDDACIANTYRGRMREIADILAGRWQPPRR